MNIKLALENQKRKRIQETKRREAIEEYIIHKFVIASLKKKIVIEIGKKITDDITILLPDCEEFCKYYPAKLEYLDSNENETDRNNAKKVRISVF